jgi:hypothetical protein
MQREGGLVYVSVCASNGVENCFCTPMFVGGRNIGSVHRDKTHAFRMCDFCPWSTNAVAACAIIFNPRGAAMRNGVWIGWLSLVGVEMRNFSLLHHATRCTHPAPRYASFVLLQRGLQSKRPHCMALRRSERCTSRQDYFAVQQLCG